MVELREGINGGFLSHTHLLNVLPLGFRAVVQLVELGTRIQELHWDEVMRGTSLSHHHRNFIPSQNQGSSKKLFLIQMEQTLTAGPELHPFSLLCSHLPPAQ